MYERFYNLRERPFALSPDPEYLFLSQVHSEALDSIRYGIESRAGFIVVTGEIGAGKRPCFKPCCNGSTTER
jgi:type II secretory pathway predicted ATPase ExeA